MNQRYFFSDLFLKNLISFICSASFLLSVFTPTNSFAQFLDTVGHVKYGITDNSICLNQPAHLIIRCDQGIDSIEYNIDSTIFVRTTKLYDANREIKSIKINEKVVAYSIALAPLKTGIYWLNDMILWSNSKIYTLTFPDSILIQDCCGSRLKTDNVLITKSKPKLSEYKDRVQGRRAKFSVWFSEDTCRMGDTIYLFVLSNRLETNHVKPFQIAKVRILQSGQSTQIESLEGERFEYYFYWMMLTPVSITPIILDDVTVEFGRREKVFRNLICFVMK